MVVFSGDLDKLIAAFIIGNGALSMGEEVSIFFTFWGLNALRRADDAGAGEDRRAQACAGCPQGQPPAPGGL